MILWHPAAERDPVPGRPGKPWQGGSGQRRLVLHTLEYTRWPNPDGVWAAPHLTYDPWRRALRQHIPFDRAAYSLRDNTDEDDMYCWQVELWGRAREVPTYDVFWYLGLAQLLVWFHLNLDVPLVFQDVWLGEGSGAADKYHGNRLTDAEWEATEGILGHQHFGWGVDTHWDPGALDIERLRQAIGALVYADFASGIVQAWAQDPQNTWNRFARILGEPQLVITDWDPSAVDAAFNAATGSQTRYWYDKLDTPNDSEWPLFIGSRMLELMAQSEEGAAS